MPAHAGVPASYQRPPRASASWATSMAAHLAFGCFPVALQEGRGHVLHVCEGREAGRGVGHSCGLMCGSRANGQQTAISEAVHRAPAPATHQLEEDPPLLPQGGQRRLQVHGRAKPGGPRSRHCEQWPPRCARLAEQPRPPSTATPARARAGRRAARRTAARRRRPWRPAAGSPAPPPTGAPRRHAR